METPIIHMCPDGHFQHIIYDLIGFIADYPEQVMLTGIVQGWCPRYTALPDYLNSQAVLHTSALTDSLTEILDLRTLWVKYGIDSNTIVQSCMSI
jgi:Plavaka transposase